MKYGSKRNECGAWAGSNGAHTAEKNRISNVIVFRKCARIE
jgi:hypothetical protein